MNVESNDRVIGDLKSRCAESRILQTYTFVG